MKLVKPRSWHWNWILIVVSLAAVAGSIQQAYSQAAYARCQGAVNESLINSSNARAEAARQDREAVDQMVKDVSSAKAAGDTRAALARYLSARAAADKSRAEHPLPKPPSVTCG